MITEYIRIPAAYEKLKSAAERSRPVYISAATGYGKTSAVLDFYEHSSILLLSGESGRLDKTPEIPEIKESVVFIDDVSFITSRTSMRYICELIENCGKQLVFAGRGNVPLWLAQTETEHRFVHITEEDLLLGQEQVALYFKAAGVDIDSDDLEEVTLMTKGYPVALSLYAGHMLDGQRFSEAMRLSVNEELCRYWDSKVFNLMDSDMIELILAMGCFDTFNADFAEFVTGNRNSGTLLEQLETVAHIILRTENGDMRFREEIREFLRWKLKRSYSDMQFREVYRRAAYWFEREDNIFKALEYYSMAQDREQIRKLLRHNSAQQVGAAHFFELKKYYTALPEEDVLSDPTLMSGMCMLCSVTLDPEGSERWYSKLKDYEKDPANPRKMRYIASVRLAYLDIALPHRAGAGMIKLMKNTFTLITNNEVKMPEFSVTSNLPSIMNGGLDFCAWSKNDNAIARFLGKPVETVLGKHGKGLINIALAESGFEKSSMKAYEVLTRLNNGISDAENGGKIEMIFAATALIVKQHLIEGQRPTAARRTENFGKKIKNEKAVFLEDNFKAFEAWFALYCGDMKTVHRFLEEAPNEQIEFNILDRYRYMVKLRCLIAEDRLSEAFDLASYLTGYFENYKRHYLMIENEMLKAVIMYRKGEDVWRELLAGALKRAEEYRFIRVFSLEGAALITMLRHLETDEVSGEFLSSVIEETSQTALYYPDYLKFVPKAEIKLTDREREILGLLCMGMSTDEICAECGISYSGLKKHNRNIYQKLGVKTRVDAERTAIQLGIIHRKGEDT